METYTNSKKTLDFINKKMDKKAFIVVNETKYVENGYFNIGK